MPMEAKITNPLKKGKGGKYKDKRTARVESSTQQMWDKVKEILATDGQMKSMYRDLHQSNRETARVLRRANKLAEKVANDQMLLQQDAMRMSLLLGAPLPEEGASSIIVGDNRYDYKPEDRGRRSLRIDQDTPSLSI